MERKRQLRSRKYSIHKKMERLQSRKAQQKLLTSTSAITPAITRCDILRNISPVPCATITNPTENSSSQSSKILNDTISSPHDNSSCSTKVVPDSPPSNSSLTINKADEITATQKKKEEKEMNAVEKAKRKPRKQKAIKEEVMLFRKRKIEQRTNVTPGVRRSRRPRIPRVPPGGYIKYSDHFETSSSNMIGREALYIMEPIALSPQKKKRGSKEKEMLAD